MHACVSSGQRRVTIVTREIFLHGDDQDKYRIRRMLADKKNKSRKISSPELLFLIAQVFVEHVQYGIMELGRDCCFRRNESEEVCMVDVECMWNVCGCKNVHRSVDLDMRKYFQESKS